MQGIETRHYIPKQPEEVSIYDIIAAAEKHTYNEGLTSQEFILGGKKLELFYNPNEHSFHGFIENTNAQTSPGETTQLYMAAYEYMKLLSETIGKPVTYTLRTESEPLIAWAKKTGDTLFSWDTTTQHDTVHVFTATIGAN